MRTKLIRSISNLESQVVGGWALAKCAEHPFQVGIAEPVGNEHAQQTAELGELHASRGTFLGLEEKDKVRGGEAEEMAHV